MVEDNNICVFVDRDGVLNRSHVRDGKSYPPDTLDEFELLPGVVNAVQDLKGAGLKVIVVTNQPDVTTGKQSLETVEAMHALLRKALNVDDIFTCFCIEGDECGCYKPKPGMLIEAANKWGVELTKSYMVGDRWRDVGAGKAAGCKTFFIDYAYNERRPDNPDYIVKNLTEASHIILKEYGKLNNREDKNIAK